MLYNQIAATAAEGRGRVTAADVAQLFPSIAVDSEVPLAADISFQAILHTVPWVDDAYMSAQCFIWAMHALCVMFEHELFMAVFDYLAGT